MTRRPSQTAAAPPAIVPGIILLLVFQLAGEVLARGAGLALPGPVLGMLGLLVLLLLRPGVLAVVAPVADLLLSHLSLLFVPAGVGVVAHWAILRDQGVAVAAALSISTLLAMGAGALSFQAVARLCGSAEEDEDV